MAINRNRSKPIGVVPKLVIGAFVLVLVGGAVHWKLDSKYKEVSKEVSKLEEESARLENIYKYEESRWREMYENPEKLDRAIREKGLAMGFPTTNQIVRIDAKGQPLPNQPSLAHFRTIIAGNLVNAK